MNVFDSTGWLIRDKGQHYLATSRGWFTLTDVPRGYGTEVPARVRGTLDGMTVRVEELRVGVLAATPAPRRPDHVVHGRTELSEASRLRLEAQQWLAGRGYTHVTLPHVWFRTEEYGATEYALGHPALGARDDLRLLQSPELPLFFALAEGLEPCWTFARCYRHEVVHDPDRDGNYLLEFEQLVVGASHTSLEELMRAAQDLVAHLAARVGVTITDDHYRVLDGRGASGAAGTVTLDDLQLFSIPSSWPARARELLTDRLRDAGARLYRLDSDGPSALEQDDPVTGTGGEVRLGALPAADDGGRVRRILDVAGTMAGAGDDVDRLVALQWNPTWSMHPDLQWGDGEQSDSSLAVRSFTSARTTTPDGRTVIRDAELHLGGVEVVHVREYAAVDDLAKQAADAGAAADLGYLNRSGEVAPPGMVGLFVGWERLVAVLCGLSGVDRTLLFPRGGDGTLRTVSDSSRGPA
ncbi:amino acid--tRNA ligase-related protein [Cellulomonas wangsupingiae]|uniref:amino acid--tRNA ligase-related protein n=1 Tax=Cellulomonas wangsupingiae TaxID=2968085 RepID=UPI001D0E0C4C|nr:amino acid--tRNA ligase-related protein [Cellulomonas wangsupingiae]MCM0638962.1 hypothetical protein [Cellulomonas wangsupingiae]